MSSENTDIACNFYSRVSLHPTELRSAEVFKPLHNPLVQCIWPPGLLQCQTACFR